MGASIVNVERLWSLPDGTVCELAVRDDASYDVWVKRGADVLRFSRLHARGTAQMLAETWRRTLGPQTD